MAKSEIPKDKGAITSGACDTGCCKVEAVVTVDSRGQLILPKELRAKAGIKAGDKLAVVAWEKQGRVCCISLQKADDLEAMVKNTLGPVMKEILK